MVDSKKKTDEPETIPPADTTKSTHPVADKTVVGNANIKEDKTMLPVTGSTETGESEIKNDTVIWGNRAKYLQQIEVILRDKGMDSRSTIQALQMIDEIIWGTRESEPEKPEKPEKK